MKFSEMKFPPPAYTNGKAEGKAEAVLTLLEHRGIVATEAERARMLACRDRVKLDDWLVRSSSVTSVAELIGDATDEPDEAAAY